MKDNKNVLHDADMVGIIHDVSNIWTRERLDIKILKLLHLNLKVSSFLVMNKVSFPVEEKISFITLNFLD